MIALVGGVLGIAGLIGAAIAVIRANIVRGTLDLYRENDAALRSRVETLESERDELKSTVNHQGGQIEALKEERAILRDLATGASAVEHLSEQVSLQHKETISLLRKITDDRRNPRPKTSED